LHVDVLGIQVRGVLALAVLVLAQPPGRVEEEKQAREDEVDDVLVGEG
jgi:hypothetical protein